MKNILPYKKLLFILPVGFLLTLFINQAFDRSKHVAFPKHDAEERPDYTIDPEEQAFYDQFRVEKQEQIRHKSASTVESYANGQIKGTWSAKQFNIPGKINYGFRMIGSAYDKENDLVYVVSHAGHIWRIDYNQLFPTLTQWTSMNHSHPFMTTSRKEWFDVMNLKDGENVTSRMVRSYDNNIEYSDDEGRNWQRSTGLTFQNTNDQGCIANTSQGERALALCKINGMHEVAISYDGINYTASNLNLQAYDYDTKILKPHYSDNVYVIARHHSTSKLSVYRMTPDSDTFSLLHSPSVTTKAPTRVIGTYTDNKYHFYYIQGDENYYSDDEGATWTKTVVTNYGNKDGNTFVRTVHPDKPHTLFRGYLDVYMSNNKGASFSDWGHKLGWDVHHMRMYQRKDGTYMHLIGKDFGVFLSSTPDVRDSYFSINHSAPAQMQYDMTVSDHFNTAFSANQDRGSMSFDNSDTPTKTDIRTTDGLRVCLANNEKAIWTWLYFGSIYHTSTKGYASSPVKSIGFAGNWEAGCMSAHPNAEKDAVVIAHGKRKLSILSYNKSDNTISNTTHPFDFYNYTGQYVTSFGYSSINTDLWYAAVKDGGFLFSTDGGKTFKKSLSGKLAKGNDQSYNYNRNQQIIKASKLEEKRVYFAGVKNAFYISDNNGLLFKTHADGLNVWRIRDFALSEDEKYIFAACGLAGPWVFSVDDDKWYPMDGPNVPYVDFTAVSYTPSKGMVQFGTYGYGVLDFKFDRGTNTLQAPSGVKATAQSFSSIQLSWNDNNSDVDSYVIKRSSDLKTFETIASVSANNKSYNDDELNANTEYFYRVIAKKADNTSLPSHMAFTSTPIIELINNSNWKVIYSSSEAEGMVAEQAFDNTSQTAWMSSASASFPQELRIDLGQAEELAAFTYVPGEKGIIKSYAFYASNDTNNWGEAIKSGTWTDENDAAGIEDFTPIQARYIRFVAQASFDGQQAGIAELQLWPGFDARLDAPINLETKVLSSTALILKWENVSVNADGYIVERHSDGEYQEVARVSSSLSSFFDKTLQPHTEYTYRLTAYRNEDKSAVSEEISVSTLKTGLINSSSWSIIYKDSETNDHAASKAFDKDLNTWWASNTTALPHEIQIDLGNYENIQAFSYVPNAQSENGAIKDYELYISDDKNNWGTPVAQGSWSQKQRQNVSFTQKTGRYVRFVAKSTLDGGTTVNVAELYLWKSYAGTTALSEKVQSQVKVYPNPFEQGFTLQNTNEYSSIELISSQGRIVHQQAIKGNTSNIELNTDLEAGFYILRLNGAKGTTIKTMIKK